MAWLKSVFKQANSRLTVAGLRRRLVRWPLTYGACCLEPLDVLRCDPVERLIPEVPQQGRAAYQIATERARIATRRIPKVPVALFLLYGHCNFGRLHHRPCRSRDRDRIGSCGSAPSTAATTATTATAAGREKQQTRNHQTSQRCPHKLFRARTKSCAYHRNPEDGQ